MITWADVVLIAPELADVPVGVQTALLADVAEQLESSQWGNDARYDMASKYLVAHLATLYLQGSGGAAGPVTSESVGSVSRSYASPSFAVDRYASTAFGREFARLRSQFVIGRMGLVM